MPRIDRAVRRPFAERRLAVVDHEVERAAPLRREAHQLRRDQRAREAAAHDRDGLRVGARRSGVDGRERRARRPEREAPQLGQRRRVHVERDQHPRLALVVLQRVDVVTGIDDHLALEQLARSAAIDEAVARGGEERLADVPLHDAQRADRARVIVRDAALPRHPGHHQQLEGVRARDAAARVAQRRGLGIGLDVLPRDLGATERGDGVTTRHHLARLLEVVDERAQARREGRIDAGNVGGGGGHARPRA